MTDEIASFKVTAADIQKQKVHPSGDVHMRQGGHFVPAVLQFDFWTWKHGTSLRTLPNVNSYHLCYKRLNLMDQFMYLY